MSAWGQIVVSNLAVALLVGVLAWVIGRHGRYSRLAHLMWVAFFVKLITPPLLSMPIAVPGAWLPEGVWQWMEMSERSASWGLPIGFPGLPLTDLVLVLWAMGTLGVFVPGVRRIVRFRRLLVREGIRDPQAEMFVASLLADRGDRRWCGGGVASPKVIRLPTRVSPMLFGLGRRAVIICPDPLWRTLSDDQRHALLAHEAAHYCRRDHWVRWLEWYVTAVYWWFPGVYFARREMERHEEASCDAWAVRQLRSSPRQYAEALLHVVDFLNDDPRAAPRLASQMHPTGMLEERLRLLMRRPSPMPESRAIPRLAITACACMWIVHPSLRPRQDTWADERSAPMAHRSANVASAPAIRGDELVLPTECELPEPPQGYWTQRSGRHWADFTLALPGARLVAESGAGITVESPHGDPLRFTTEEMSALAEIPETQRVVIGDALGRVRLWDLRAGMAVSLLGRHHASVSSLAYHPSFGVISADAAGAIMRFDPQSGQVLASWANGLGPVQSVRCSNDGETVAVLVGSWHDHHPKRNVYYLNALSLQVERRAEVPLATAVVLQIDAEDWVGVEWSGRVRRVATGQPLAMVAKQDVSALVLSQAARMVWTSTVPEVDPARLFWEALW